MKTPGSRQALALFAGATFLVQEAKGQSVLFDFDTAPLQAPLPISLTVGGVTAQFTATGNGFSIQRADTMGFTPVGFSGYCIYPSSGSLADLLVAFNLTLTDFSILYAPQELGCDSSATMRVTAYLDGIFVGTATTNAFSPGTWPSETLAFSSAQGFNSVVVHYDARPACGDYGTIFMADNMVVTPAPQPPPPPTLTITSLPGQIQLAWPTNGAVFNLQVNLDLLNTNTWSLVTNVPVVVGADNTVTLPLGTNASFYRLKYP